MYRLTKIRLRNAEDILEKYRSQLYRDFAFNAGQLECELRDCWRIGYQELKGIALDMLKNDRYRHIAIYYMENSNCPGVVCEFQSALAKAYGIPWYYDPGREKKQEEFWATFKANVYRNDGRERV